MILKHSYISIRQKRGSAGSWKGAKIAAFGAALAHLKYIRNRPGEDKEKGGRETFDSENDQADSKAFREELKNQKTRGTVIHKLMLSPDVPPGDPKAFTREILDQIAEEKALDLRWQAVIHSNTDNPHIHVVVLAKDRNGREVRFDKRDHKKMKEIGDRFLDREHPLEREKVRQDRERKEQELKKEKERAFKEKVSRGEHLPWFRKKIVREQLESYHAWKRAQMEKELLPEPTDSAGSYARAKSDDKEGPEKFEHNGKEYSEKSTREELEGLNKFLYENREDYDKRLPKADFGKLQKWLDSKDRAYMANYLEGHTQRLIERDNQKQMDEKSQVGGRVMDPMQEAVSGNPAIGALVKAGQVIGMVVGMIRLDDLRDPLGEAHQYLMSMYGEVKEVRSDKAADLDDVTGEDKTLDQIDESLEEVKQKKAERTEKEKLKREEAERKRMKEMRDGMEGFS